MTLDAAKSAHDGVTDMFANVDLPQFTKHEEDDECSPRQKKRRRGCLCIVLLVLIWPVTFLYSCAAAVVNEARQKKRELSESKEEDVMSRDMHVELKCGAGKDAPGFGLVVCLLKPLLWTLVLLKNLNIAFSTGNLAVVKHHAKVWLLIISVCCAMYWQGQRALDAVRATESERLSCHVCVDTSIIPGPPCEPATYADFVVHKEKLEALKLMMNNHVTADEKNHLCIASFHKGSRCARVSVFCPFSQLANAHTSLSKGLRHSHQGHFPHYYVHQPSGIGIWMGLAAW